ncbi:UNVERIFIED_CONTAM: hypothetical protein FKN15_022016 [Acipenser sinensis]
MADGSKESKYRNATTEQATEETRLLGHRDRVKAGRYDGRTSWEAYRAKFQMVAQANGWNQAEKAVQLAAALEGEALRALLDLSDEELADYRAVVTALDHRFGGTEPATSLRQRLASRTRHSGEKLGVFAAEIRYLTRKGYPHFAAEVQEDLATEAFLRGLTPDALRRHVRLTAPASLELALSQAKMVEEVLEENPLNRALEGGPLGRLRPRARQARGLDGVDSEDPEAEEGIVRPLQASVYPRRPPADPQARLCWRCGQAGHIQRFCSARSTPAGAAAKQATANVSARPVPPRLPPKSAPSRKTTGDQCRRDTAGPSFSPYSIDRLQIGADIENPI